MRICIFSILIVVSFLISSCVSIPKNDKPPQKAIIINLDNLLPTTASFSQMTIVGLVKYFTEDTSSDLKNANVDLSQIELHSGMNAILVPIDCKTIDFGTLRGYITTSDNYFGKQFLMISPFNLFISAPDNDEIGLVPFKVVCDIGSKGEAKGRVAPLDLGELNKRRTALLEEIIKKGWAGSAVLVAKISPDKTFQF